MNQINQLYIIYITCVPLVTDDIGESVDVNGGVDVCVREASKGLLVSVCANDTNSCVVLGTGGVGGSDTGTCVLSKLCASGLDNRDLVPIPPGELSIPSCNICARRNVFSFSKTVIWFCNICIALADFSANFAVDASCSFCSKSSMTYSTVFSSTVPLLYTY